LAPAQPLPKHALGMGWVFAEGAGETKHAVLRQQLMA
jgi:hypothetical protein